MTPTELLLNTVRPKRVIGFRHRIKQTAQGQARPSHITIIDTATDEVTEFDLEDENAEVDFVLGRLPISWRNASEDEDVSQHPPHHIKTAKRGAGQIKVPASYDGLKPHDAVATMLGGSGGYFALACARRGDKIGAHVFRLTPGSLKDNRSGDDKSEDAFLMADLLMEKPSLFYDVRERDSAGILVVELLRARTEAMQARIACGQRLRQQAIGAAYRAAGDLLTGIGDIEAEFDKLKASDIVYLNLEKEEARRMRELDKAVQQMDVYQQVFANVNGVGPAIAARIIAAVGDIRRFKVTADQGHIDFLRKQIKEYEALGEVDDWKVSDLDRVSYDGEDATADKAKASYAEALATGDRRRQIQIIRSNKLRMTSRARKEYNNDLAAKLHSEVQMLELSIKLRDELGELHRKAEQQSENRFLAYCGVGLRMEDVKIGNTVERRGVFMRRQAGKRANWHPDARQGFYLLADQWNKRPDSEWGIKLREIKAKFREKHPEEVKVIEGDKTRTHYTDGHIHRMAIWRTITLFAKWVFREWNKLEDSSNKADRQTA